LPEEYGLHLKEQTESPVLLEAAVAAAAAVVELMTTLVTVMGPQVVVLLDYTMLTDRQAVGAEAVVAMVPEEQVVIRVEAHLLYLL